MQTCYASADGCGGDGVWMTPNQFQRASGRGTARDWKRSIKHHGVSLKSLMSKRVLSLDAAAPGCRCNLCTVGLTLAHQPTRVFMIARFQGHTFCGVVCLIVCVFAGYAILVILSLLLLEIISA